MMNENDCILSVRGLDIRFNLRGRVLHAIRGIDLDLYRGEVLAVVGESGSGKSVFTKSFMGLLDTNGSITGGTIDYYPTPGAEPVRLSGLKTEKDWLRIRGREIAMIMQDPMTSLNPLKTIGDQILEAVTLHQGLKGTEARARTLEYLRDVGISDPEVRFKQYPHEFSGGMRQRVVIAHHRTGRDHSGPDFAAAQGAAGQVPPDHRHDHPRPGRRGQHCRPGGRDVRRRHRRDRHRRRDLL